VQPCLFRLLRALAGPDAVSAELGAASWLTTPASWRSPGSSPMIRPAPQPGRITVSGSRNLPWRL